MRAVKLVHVLRPYLPFVYTLPHRHSYSGIYSVKVDSLSCHDMNFTDPGRAPPYYIEDVPLRDTTLVSPGRMTTRGTRPIQKPTTAPALYQNLLYLLSYHRTSPPSLSRLVAYHASFPILQSTRSYNLLVGLALRHASFGTVARLLSSMRAQGVREDLETWKLEIRWLVRSSRWEDAWREVMQTIGREGYGAATTPQRSFGHGTGGMPLPIWLEFLGTAKRGAFRMRRGEGIRTKDEVEAVKRDRGLEVVEESEDRTLSDYSRFELLINNLPDLTVLELGRIPPRMVFLVVQMMLRTDQKQAALDLTRSYLNGLPDDMDDKWCDVCLDIIHLHIIFERRRGLSAHHFTRRTTNNLLGISRCLRPNSTTLFQLLGHLKHTKKCGTIAYGFVNRFKERWGWEVEDGRVRRRVATLGLKEGRMDIVMSMVRGEIRSRWERRIWKKKGEKIGKRLLRKSTKKIFKKKGKEVEFWRMLNLRIKRRINK